MVTKNNLNFENFEDWDETMIENEIQSLNKKSTLL